MAKKQKKRKQRSTKGVLIKGIAKNLPGEVLTDPVLKRNLQNFCVDMRAFMLFIKMTGYIMRGLHAVYTEESGNTSVIDMLASGIIFAFFLFKKSDI